MHLYRVCRYAYNASIICAKVRKILDGDGIDAAAARDLIAAADRLERDRPEPLVPTSHEQLLRNFRVLSTRTFYCSFRMKLNLRLLELFDKIYALDPDHDAEWMQAQYEQYITTVRDLADEILADVPFVFRTGDLSGKSNSDRPRYWTDGLRLLWPLRLVAFWRATREDQKKAAGLTLWRIREELGIQQATVAFVPRPFS